MNVNESDYKIIISWQFFIFLMSRNAAVLFIYNEYKQVVHQLIINFLCN